MKSLVKPYVGANCLGLICYTALFLRIMHQQHAEQREPDFGDSLNYLLTAFPVLVGLTLVNLSWEIWALVRLVRYGESRPFAIGGASLLIWAATYFILRQLP
jgi:hypothetical protein